MCVQMCVCMQMCLYVCVHACMHACVCVSVCMCKHVCTCVCNVNNMCMLSLASSTIEVLTVPTRGNVALACIFLSSGEFDSMVSRVHLLFYSTNLEKLQWIYARRSCHSTS